MKKKEDVIVVKSSESGLLSHLMDSWQIDGLHFVKGALSQQAQACNDIFDGWLEKVDNEERRIFVNDLFEAITANGSKTLSDISNQGINALYDILLSLTQTQKKSKYVFFTLIKSMWNRFIKIDYVQLLKSKVMIVPVILFLIGLIFIAIPQYAQKVIGIVLFSVLLGYSLYNLYFVKKEYENDKTRYQYKFLFYSIIVAIEILCIIWNQILVFSSNVFLGVFLVYRAYVEMKKGLSLRHQHQKSWIFYLLNAFIAGLLGVVALSTSSEILWEYVIIVGSYLMIWGVIDIIKILNDATLVSLKKEDKLI